MRIINQAFTGGFEARMDCNGAPERLVSFSNLSGADTVIIGWNTSAPYDEVIAKLHEQNVSVFLWLPVFSEYGKHSVTALDYLGNQHKVAISDADDDFTFACPSKVDNIDLSVQYFDRSFRDFPFDGVFLDKIRFSSFGNGFRSGMGCFCDDCCHFYRNEGVDIHAFKRLMENRKKDFLIPSARHGMVYAFENKLIDDLFRARAKLITTSVNRVVEMFRQRGLKVGLDVFAPPFAYLCGQDIAALADCADFLKPMMYRVTNAPAGLPYELEWMKSELAKNGCDIGNTLEALWGTTDLTSDECFASQLEALEKTACETCAGVEINKVDFCATNPEYVKKAIQTIHKAGIAGYVLSWNVLAQTVYP